MKKVVLSMALMLVVTSIGLACPVCERNQPKLLKGLTHGAGPEGNLDYIIVGVVVLISLLTLLLSIKKLINPGEKQDDHIKRSILNTNDHA